MRTTIAVLSSLAALAAAQSLGISDIPSCATQCFGSAVSSSSCPITDAYCQCTKGSAEIAKSLISCLCTSTCSTTDLAKVQQVSNSLCSAALSASGETYTPTTAGADACQTGGSSGGAAAGSGSSASSIMMSSAAAGQSTMAAGAGSMSSMAPSMAASSSASVEQQTGNAAAPQVTGFSIYQGAWFGVAGLGLMAL